MPSLLVLVGFENDSMIPEDRVINTFSFATPDVLPATLDRIEARLTAFYNAVQLNANSVANLMSNHLEPNFCTFKIYNRADAKPRRPIRESAWTLQGLAGQGGFPNEVSLCLSFRGGLVSGAPAGRRRGRVYIGPLSAGKSEEKVGETRPSLVAQTTLSLAGLSLISGNDAATTWMIHSQVANSDTPVVVVHVDDAYDTQRRRGRDALTRVVQSEV